MVQPTGSHGWGIPKGGVEPGESLETAARREFIEETGITLDPARPLKFLRGSGDAIKGGKKIHAFLYEGEGSEVYLGSNIIESGFRAGQPENCAGRFMTIEEAKRCVHKNQLKLIELYDIFYKYRKDT
jgi:8-oxo-dGTP pyrophosphatase MutT (NUDIX family)